MKQTNCVIRLTIGVFVLVCAIFGLVVSTNTLAGLAPLPEQQLFAYTRILKKANDQRELDNTIKVGVRRDARPFSYASSSKSGERYLPGYGGYMIEICRSVLEEIISSGIVGKNISVKAIDVSAEKRFDDLDNRKVDLLCGPDSITLNRLKKYSVSHPVYLSGTTYISLPTERLPRFKYCEGIIGVLDGTTAEVPGLERIAKSGELQRFDVALDGYLEQLAKSRTPNPLLDDLAQLTDDIDWLMSGKDLNQKAGGRSKVVSNSVKTRECPQGFRVGPVVVYDSHEKGLADFCAEKIFFYIGDVDIITRNSTCDYIARRETLASESYGFYFRNFTNDEKEKNDANAEASISKNCFDTLEKSKKCEQNFRDLLLYSVFNNTLLRKMQSKEDVLMFEFEMEFGDDPPTQDLKNFFDIFKYASGH